MCVVNLSCVCVYVCVCVCVCLIQHLHIIYVLRLHNCVGDLDECGVCAACTVLSLPPSLPPSPSGVKLVRDVSSSV